MTKEFDDLTLEYIHDTFGSTEPQCFKCKHYNGGGTCKAFPDNTIPTGMFMVGKKGINHTKPYQGDHGIQFEVKDSGIK